MIPVSREAALFPSFPRKRESAYRSVDSRFRACKEIGSLENVIPAKAGIHVTRRWMPAFAGMTEKIHSPWVRFLHALIRGNDERSAGFALLRRMLRCRRGATAIEFALILPCFLLLIFGTIEAGRLMWTQMSLQYAVDAAARCASLKGDSSSCATATDTEAYAASAAPGMTFSSSDFTASSPSCGYEVTASYPWTSLVPGLIPWNITLTAQSCRPAV